MRTWTFPGGGGDPWDDLWQDRPWFDECAAADAEQDAAELAARLAETAHLTLAAPPQRRPPVDWPAIRAHATERGFPISRPLDELAVRRRRRLRRIFRRPRWRYAKGA